MSTIQHSNDDSPLSLRILGRMAKHQQEKQQETSFIKTTKSEPVGHKINKMLSLDYNGHLRKKLP